MAPLRAEWIHVPTKYNDAVAEFLEQHALVVDQDYWYWYAPIAGIKILFKRKKHAVLFKLKFG